MNTITVWGIVNQDGTVGGGSGFSVTAQGNGEYIISFSPQFSGTPAVIGTQNQLGKPNQNPLDGVVFPFVNKGAATALTGDGAGNFCNRTFAFIAIGPA